MRVTTNIRRSDIVKLNLYFLPRLAANWILVGALTLVAFAFLVLTHTPATGVSWLTMAGISVAAGVGGLLGGCLCSLLWVLAVAGERNGVLGRHVYALTKQGLHESTKANEGVQKWSGIQSVHKSAHCIYIRINGYLFHLIPRRSFRSAKQFEAFWQEAYGYWKRAAARKPQIRQSA